MKRLRLVSRHFYKRFIESPSPDPDSHSREVVLNCLLIGMMGLSGIAFLNTLVSFIFIHDRYLSTRLFLIFLVFGFFFVLYSLSRRQSRKPFAEISLVTVFFVSAGLVLLQWGTINPVGILLLGLSIVMAGILLGSRYSLYVAGICFALLTVLEYAKAGSYLKPDMSWIYRGSSMTDVVSFTAIFLIIALISWLFNRQMEVSLRRAQRSEKALKRQKALLEVKVERRTRQLQAIQLEKVQQLYRFVELGRISTALFHDLANHLTSVSLDIEGLKSQGRSALTRRIQDNIHYIDSVVQRVHEQVQGKSRIEIFEVVEQIDGLIQVVLYNARKSGVDIKLEAPEEHKKITYRGDLTKFRQLITNLLSNSIESYANKNKKQQYVITVQVDKNKTGLVIRVIDQGAGISPGLLPKIFEPFYTTKEKGVGIGLFIVKQIIEQDFGGSISVTSNKKDGTTFTVNLPLKSHGAGSKN